ncbi:unnamed protein product, partial [Ectocarpus sp. 12 AP-2014]
MGGGHNTRSSNSEGNPADILLQKRKDLAGSKKAYPPRDDVQLTHDLVIQVGTVVRFEDQMLRTGPGKTVTAVVIEVRSDRQMAKDGNLSRLVLHKTSAIIEDDQPLHRMGVVRDP